MDINRNTGLIIQPPSETDFIAGGISGIEFQDRLNSGNWSQYLPVGENQHKYNSQAVLDTMACVSFSALNCLEIQYKFLTGQEINFSDRFIAKMSGTTHEGNYLQKVADTIRHAGLVTEEDWPWDFNETFTWEEYYKEIPQEIQDKGKKFLENWEISYEWIVSGTPNDTILKQHLAHTPLQIAIKTCSPWGANPPVCSGPINHAVTLFNRDLGIFDHYNPFEKQLSQGYYIPWAMKLLLTPKNMRKPLAIKAEGDATVFVESGGVWIPLGTSWDKFLEIYPGAVVKELSVEEFAKLDSTRDIKIVAG